LNFLSPPNGVQFYTINSQTVDALWSKIKFYDPLFSDDSRWDQEKFYQTIFSKGTVLLEFDQGILFLTDLALEHYARIHACFWDHKISMRLPLLKECLSWAFGVYSLVRLEAIIPDYSKALKRVLENKLCFKFEGRMRKRMLYKGRFHDVLIYSLLREEMERWVEENTNR
jgi:hypothetical protein